MTNEDSDAHINWSLVLGHWSFVFRPFDAPPPLAYKYLGPESHCRKEALARGSREPGQALTGAAISGVLLCEGPFSAVKNPTRNLALNLTPVLSLHPSLTLTPCVANSRSREEKD